MVVTPTSSRPSTPQTANRPSSSSSSSTAAAAPIVPAGPSPEELEQLEARVAEKFAKEAERAEASTSSAASTSAAKKSAVSKPPPDVERFERSKYLEEYSRNVRTPRCQSARGHPTPSHPAKAETSTNSTTAAEDRRVDRDDAFDYLPLSGWSDDTLVGLPTSYVLYDKFQLLSTSRTQHQQRATSAKPSGSKKSAVATRLVSSSKGPRRTVARATTPTRTQRIKQRDRELHSAGVRVYSDHHSSGRMEVEDDEHENGRGQAAKDWPNSLRIVVPYKLKPKQRGQPFMNPNLHHSGNRSSGGTRDYRKSTKESRSSASLSTALQVQQQRGERERERERERSAAMAKARLLSNYRNRHNRIHENEEPLLVKKALDTTHIQPIHKQSWRK